MALALLHSTPSFFLFCHFFQLCPLVSRALELAPSFLGCDYFICLYCEGNVSFGLFLFSSSLFSYSRFSGDIHFDFSTAACKRRGEEESRRGGARGGGGGGGGVVKKYKNKNSEENIEIFENVNDSNSKFRPKSKFVRHRSIVTSSTQPSSSHPRTHLT